MGGSQRGRCGGEALKEKDVGKEADQLEQDNSNIGSDYTDHQGKPGDRQYAPSCGEISECCGWGDELVGCNALLGLGWFFHGPAFFIPLARTFGAAVFSFSTRPPPVRRKTASTNAGPASCSSCRAATPSLRKSASPSAVMERAT